VGGKGGQNQLLNVGDGEGAEASQSLQEPNFSAALWLASGERECSKPKPGSLGASHSASLGQKGAETPLGAEEEGRRRGGEEARRWGGGEGGGKPCPLGSEP
jgi:hypothetical protein